MSRAESAQANILLITVCTFRYDHLGAAGYQRNTTPFLDSLATNGVFFEQSFSSSSWTQPATTSILTGLTPNVHRMTTYYPTGAVAERKATPERLLADDVVTIAEHLHDVGYTTFCRVNNVQAGDFFNIPQGFDDGVTDHRMDTRQMLGDLEAWLRSRDPSRPFFAFLLTRDTHFVHSPRYEFYRDFNRAGETLGEEQYRTYPYELYESVKRQLQQGVAKEMQTRYIDLYDAELAQLDHDLSALKSVLEAANHGSDTIIVITGDHGERFFENGQMSHSGRPDEAVVRVPLIFFGNGVVAGRRIKQVVRSIDIYPTLAALAGSKPPRVVQGRSLLPLILGETEELPAVTAFASFQRGGKQERYVHMVRDERYKLYSTGELFDVGRDPIEQQDLASSEPGVVQRLQDQLDRWLRQEEVMRGLLEEGTSRPLSTEMIEQLRSLGYIE